jgi:hypothetical protein
MPKHSTFRCLLVHDFPHRTCIPTRTTESRVSRSLEARLNSQKGRCFRHCFVRQTLQCCVAEFRKMPGTEANYRPARLDRKATGVRRGDIWGDRAPSITEDHPDNEASSSQTGGDILFADLPTTLGMGCMVFPRRLCVGGIGPVGPCSLCPLINNGSLLGEVRDIRAHMSRPPCPPGLLCIKVFAGPGFKRRCV